MRSSFCVTILLSLLLGFSVPDRTIAVQLTDPSGSVQVKWPVKKIKVGISTSLSAPGPEIKPGSDVIGAVRRALSRWSSVASIQFVEVPTTAQSVSPAS